MSCPVPTGAPASRQLDAPATPDPGCARRRPSRTPYLWGGLLLVPVLIAGGLYLASGPGAPARVPGAASSGPGTAAASSSGAAPSPAGAAVTPFHVSLARVPAHAHRSSAGRAASPSASASHATPRGSASAAASRPAASASAPPPASQQGTPADQVLALINQARASAGLSPLTVTSDLDASASAHNLKMAGGCGLTHECPGEPAIGARETAAGVSWTAAGENIGEGGPMPDTTAAMAQMAVTLTQDMLNEQPPDDGHRLNILSSTFTHIGIAVYRDSSGTVWMTQDFSN